MDTKPKVSVLIPAYNAAQWIVQTIHSVLDQDYENLEVVVVDDGSADGTAEAVRSISASRVRLIRSGNAGAAAARNTAFQASSGDYVQFLDADDLISPGKIGAQVTLLMKQPTAIASCAWQRFYERTPETDQRSFSIDHDAAPIDWLVECWREGAGMQFPAMWMIPRPVLSTSGLWREDLSLNDDGEFFTRVVLASSRVLFCPGECAYYRSGVNTSLSGRRTSEAWRSGFMAIESMIGAAMKAEDSERVRRCGALLWQVFAHSAYPYERRLAKDALRLAAELHEMRIAPQGGAAFRAAKALLGWKAARTLQVWSGRP